MGIIFWEIFSTLARTSYEGPYHDFPVAAVGVQLILATAQGLRPTFPAKTQRDAVELCKLCWAHDPTLRPTSNECLSTIVEWKIKLEECPDSFVSNVLAEELKTQNSYKTRLDEKPRQESGTGFRGWSKSKGT